MNRTWVTADGVVRLYLGDALAWLPRMDLSDTACITDPPFGIGYSSGHGSELWGDGSIAGDDDTTVRDRVLGLLGDMPSLVFGSWRKPRPAGTKMVLIWDTLGALGMGDLRLPWKPAHQEIYVLGDSAGFVGERGSDVIRHPPVQSMAKNGRVHPFEKPVGLLEMLAAKVRASTIIDPFMGSGSQGVACIRQRKSFVGIESDQKHFETACERIEEETSRHVLFEPPPQIQRSFA